MGRGAKIPESGIYIIQGIPGSGKSYLACQRIVVEVLFARRVVYTNLPLRWKTFRAYLAMRGRMMGVAADVARRLGHLVRPLSEGHFRAFCERLVWVDRRAGELVRAEGGHSLADDPTFVERSARARALVEVCEKLGPEVVTGAGANWIPPMAVVVIDELHKWLPNAAQAKEPMEVLAYTSMHRHLLHKVYVLTQRAMNVSLSFRAMAAEYWQVVNLRRMKFFWFLRFPCQVFVYRRYSGADCARGEVQPGAEALEGDWEVPWLSGGVVFRLYDSHSHVMGLSEARARVRGLMVEAGTIRGGGGSGGSEIVGRGATSAPRFGREGVKVGRKGRLMKIARSMGIRVIGGVRRLVWAVLTWPFRHWFVSALCLVVFFVSRGMSRGGGGGSRPGAAGGSGGGGVAVVAAAASQPVERLVLQGLLRNGVLINGVHYGIGSECRGGKLLGVWLERGCSIWRVGGGRGLVWWLDGRVQVYGVGDEGSWSGGGGRGADGALGAADGGGAAVSGRGPGIAGGGDGRGAGGG